ncbi:MAG: FKBP-type peptidyl-prolyl cis-trans isomerase [Myxococcota bacterium]|nr:FKBP-type peptidyl-prolyl cis-trans isomerase [Myxococcota bacterium]
MLQRPLIPWILPFAIIALSGCQSDGTTNTTAPKTVTPTAKSATTTTTAPAKPAATAKPAAAKTKPATTTPEKAAPKTDGKEIVFNPKFPPAGYKNCHRNHCHRVGGGVASYQQVMAEIGATKLEGVPKMGPMPAAPPDVAAPPADAKRLKSGLVTKVLTTGTGKAKPAPEDTVKVHYTGWTTDGTMFDSSVKRGKPTEFPLTRVFPGWQEALQLMSVGEERRLWVPQALAFNGKPGRPTGTLVFDIELIDIRK